VKKRDLIILFLLSIAVTTAVASIQRAPGYMDAEFYFSGGTALATGQGFQENFLWNYLDSPTGLPHPSHTYWMPLASMVAAISPALSKNLDFQNARIPFIFLSGLVPVLTSLMAVSFSKERRDGWMAGLLAVFPGFYLVYAGTTDTFILYMLLGASFMLLATWIFSRSLKVFDWQWGGLGLIAGLMHLARADGILWLFIAMGCLIVVWLSIRDSVWQLFKGVGWIWLGYLVVMGPWMVRTLFVTGSPLSPGGWHALWILNYDEMYSFPVNGLTFQRWWSAGIAALAIARGEALLAELKTLLGVQGEIFLLPLALAGGWHLRKSRVVQMGLVAWLIILSVMTFVFPFAGSRGGFLHAGAAIQPLLWALVPIGFKAAISWVGRARKWNIPQASRVFSVGLVAIAVVYTGMISYTMVIGKDRSQPIWNSGWKSSLNMKGQLETLGVPPDAIIMVNNPPGFTAASARRSIVIPDGSLDSILQAATQYGATYLIVEFNHVKSLDGLYEKPRSLGRFELIEQSPEFSIFRIGNE
jgi:hypothetical protein